MDQVDFQNAVPKIFSIKSARSGHCRYSITLLAAEQNVCFWHKADMTTAFCDVCFRGNSGHWSMSALPPKADIAESDWHVRFVPKADNIDPVLHYATERSAHSFVTSWSIGTCLTTFPSQ
jgi:hypothetical protein